MELEDLNETERLALAGLMRAIVFADRAASGEEADRIEDVVLAVGDEAYQRALDGAEKLFGSEDALKAFLVARVNRQEARDLIYGTVLDIAMVDGVGIREESELLSWLSAAWNLEPQLLESVPA